MERTARAIAALILILSSLGAYFYTEHKNATGVSSGEVSHVKLHAKASCSINGCMLTANR
ncbi:MAG: hypothetical protein K6G15_03325 [Desulfovibrio sp.]|nr:hypothetical protein [Desulfovibrio sp.]